MSTLVAASVAIICMVGIIQGAFTVIINRKYRGCPKEIVKRFTSTFGMGNLLFTTGTVMQGMVPASVRNTNVMIGFLGLTIMFAAFYKFRLMLGFRKGRLA